MKDTDRYCLIIYIPSHRGGSFSILLITESGVDERRIHSTYTR